MREWFNLQAIYVLWLREMKRHFRAKSRMVGSLGMPFFFLIFLGTGFKDFKPSSVPPEVDYLNFLAPGILAIVLQFGSMFTGISILWDRQFGFLKEIMVAPVSRVAIVLGRTVGGVTTALCRAFFSLVLHLSAGSGFCAFPAFSFHSFSGVVSCWPRLRLTRPPSR